MKKIIWAVVLLVMNVNPIWAQPQGNDQYQTYSPDGIPFRVANQDWNPDSLGNHRAIVEVAGNTDGKVAVATLKWRRPDLNPASKDVFVYTEKGQKVENVCCVKCDAEEGTIYFEAIQGGGKYYLYYLPYHMRIGWGEGRGEPNWNDYYQYDSAKGEKWLNSVNAKDATAAQVIAFESRNDFEFFSQMGNIATAEETQHLLEQHPENPIIFTEDRCFPIRLTRQMPVRWAMEKPSESFQGIAHRNEYYVWQIALWAARQGLEDVKVRFSDLKMQGSDHLIPANELTCFNQGGLNWDGTRLYHMIKIPEGRIQSLWCGVQIPEKATPGEYKGIVTITAKGMEPRQVDVRLTVKDQILTEKGDNEPWRLSRLRWLDSSIGLDDHPVAPFSAMKLQGKTIKATEKSMTIENNGMPKSISVNGHEVLSRPIQVELETNDGTLCMNGGKLTIQQQADGLVCWTSLCQQKGIEMLCRGRMEFDGHVHYDVSLSSEQAIELRDIRFCTQYSTYAQEYMMGAGYSGGLRPKTLEWDWSGPYDSYWMGGAEAGLHFEFRGGTYHGPLISDYKPLPPASWSNHGEGRLCMSGEKEACVVTHTGKKQLNHTPLTFEFALDITPLKPVDTKHQFGMRFYHSPDNTDQAIEKGANVINIHHATKLNPVINYPFIVQEPLKKFIREKHAQGVKVKLYYTIRELTNHVSEIYALKSLGNEIFSAGMGNGAPWLCEHLVEDYRPAWYTSLENNVVDASCVLSPHSRWINYYLEGLRWMLQNYEIDGIYMDDVSFDRTIMKRMRKIMAQYRPEGIIDLHSNTGYSKGPANQYTDFFPYVDRLWFGESFRYNQMRPDEWFVTFSGIPFGPMSEMLQDGGNRFLGTLYGATTRLGCSAHSPAPVWKIWKEFGIEDARMCGYWDKQCPITTSDDEVKATAYLRDGKALISIGNFSESNKDITLHFDWKGLGIKKEKATFKFPEVEDFQPAGTYAEGETIHLPAKEGRFLLITQ